MTFWKPKCFDADRATCQKHSEGSVALVEKKAVAISCCLQRVHKTFARWDDETMRLIQTISRCPPSSVKLCPERHASKRSRSMSLVISSSWQESLSYKQSFSISTQLELPSLKSKPPACRGRYGKGPCRTGHCRNGPVDRDR